MSHEQLFYLRFSMVLDGFDSFSSKGFDSLFELFFLNMLVFCLKKLMSFQAVVGASA